jgi:MFS family permease
MATGSGFLVSIGVVSMIEKCVNQSQKNLTFIVVTCVALFALGQFHRASGSVFSPILIERLSLTGTAIGVLAGAMFFANIIAQTPLGAALDRFGARLMVTLGVLLTAIGTVWFAVADGYWSLLSARALIGFGLTVTGPGINVVIARYYPAKQFGFMMGLIGALGGTGGLLGTYPLSLALSNFAWTSVFLFVSLITALLIAMVVFSFENPAPKTEEEIHGGSSSGYLELLKSAEIWKILALGTCTFAPITAITGLWGGPYFETVHQATSDIYGGIMFFLFSASITASLAFGVLDRVMQSRKRLILTSVVVSVTSLLVLAAIPNPNIYLAAGLLFAMVFCQQFYIALWAHLRKVVPQAVLGRAMTLILLSSVAAIPTMQTLIGMIIDFTLYLGTDIGQSYRVAFAFMALCIALAGFVYSKTKMANN